RVSARAAGSLRVLSLGGPKLPPLALLVEGGQRLVAIDTRTGEPVWRYTEREGGPLTLARAGRILLLASGEGVVRALDVTSGDELWRFARDTRFVATPAVAGDRALLASSGGEDGPGALYLLDLF